MATYPASTNMNLLLPQQSNATSPEAGPLWATDLNAAFTLVDQHDHSTGKGAQVTPAGLNMNANLPFLSGGNYFGPTLQGYSGFYNNPSAEPAGLPNAGLYVKAGDLWYKNSAGALVQVSSGSTLNVNVTNAYAGFYGAYANGTTSANAVAYFNNTTKGFEFNRSIPTVPLGYSNLAHVYGADYISYANGTGGFGTAGSIASLIRADGTNSTYSGTPKGGYGFLDGGAGIFEIAFDVTANGTGSDYPGTYKSIGLSLANLLSPVQNALPQWRFGVGVPGLGASGGTGAAPQYPIDINWYGGGGNSTVDLASFCASTANTPGAGFGPRLKLRAATATWSGTNSFTNAAAALQSTIEGFWGSTNLMGGVRLRGAYNGTGSTTAGLEVAALSGTGDSVGIGGAATALGTATIYGSIVPSGGATLGTTSTPFGNAYFTNWHAGAGGTALAASVGSNTLTIPSSGLSTLTSGLQIGAGGSSGGSNLAATVYLSGTATPYAGSVEYGTNNAVRAWGRLGGSSTVTAGFNVASQTTSIPTAGYLRFDITFTTAMGGNNAIIATVDSSDTVNHPYVNWAIMTGTTTASIYINTGGASINGVYFMVVGA